MTNFEAKDLNLTYKNIEEVNSDLKFIDMEDFLIFLKNNINRQNDNRILDMFCGEFERFKEYHDQGINIYGFETRKEKFKKFYSDKSLDEFIKLGNLSDIPWRDEFFDGCIFDGPNVNLEFESYQIIFSEIARVLKKNSYFSVNLVFEKNDYFKNNFINIKKFKKISIEDFSSSFCYCQTKRLLEPFFKILDYSPIESKNNKSDNKFFWKILSKRF